VKAILKGLAKKTDERSKGKDFEGKKIEAKFYFAGHSVCYMFYMTLEAVKKNLKDNINAASAVSKVLEGLEGDGSMLAINHLSPLVDGKKQIVSQYTLGQLFKRFGFSGMIQLINYSISRKNPSMLGWVFQEKFAEPSELKDS